METKDTLALPLTNSIDSDSENESEIILDNLPKTIPQQLTPPMVSVVKPVEKKERKKYTVSQKRLDSSKLNNIKAVEGHKKAAQERAALKMVEMLKLEEEKKRAIEDGTHYESDDSGTDSDDSEFEIIFNRKPRALAERVAEKPIPKEKEVKPTIKEVEQVKPMSLTEKLELAARHSSKVTREQDSSKAPVSKKSIYANKIFYGN